MPNAMERRSTFAAITVGKSFCPPLPVLSRRASLDAAADKSAGCHRPRVRPYLQLSRVTVGRDGFTVSALSGETVILYPE